MIKYYFAAFQEEDSSVTVLIAEKRQWDRDKILVEMPDKLHRTLDRLMKDIEWYEFNDGEVAVEHDFEEFIEHLRASSDWEENVELLSEVAERRVNWRNYINNDEK